MQGAVGGALIAGLGRLGVQRALARHEEPHGSRGASRVAGDIRLLDVGVGGTDMLAEEESGPRFDVQWVEDERVLLRSEPPIDTVRGQRERGQNEAEEPDEGCVRYDPDRHQDYGRDGSGDDAPK